MPRAHEIHKRNQLFTPGPRYFQFGPKQRTGRPYFIRIMNNPGFCIPMPGGRRLHWCLNRGNRNRRRRLEKV